MLLDLSSRPIKVTPEECPHTVVVRTNADATADGIVRRWNEKYKKRTLMALAPIASLERGGITCMETALSLDHIVSAKPGFKPDPFEVVSFYKDSITGQPGIWRLMITVERRTGPKNTPKVPVWYITVIEEAKDGAPVSGHGGLFTMVTKELSTDSLFKEPTPLQRLIKSEQGPRTLWDRLAEND